VQLVGWALFLLLLAYPFATAVAISQWGEQQMPLTDSVYFCISAIFTIGFGDLLLVVFSDSFLFD
jgi:hypothetical protein